MYATMFGKDLVEALKEELGGDFQDTVQALFKPPADFDAWALHEAMSGLGTDESTLVEIMCSRTNDEIEAIKEAYNRLYDKDLASELKSETSGHFKKLLYSLAQASRNEGEDIDPDLAIADAAELFEAGENSWGTDESRFNVVMASRSYLQLNLIFEEYEKISGKDIEEAIKSEMSGDLKDGMLAIIRCARDRVSYFAKRLHKSMDGLGTDDQTLIRNIVSRSEVDLADVKEAFQLLYEKSLEEWIEDDTSGDYKKILIAICKGNKS